MLKDPHASYDNRMSSQLDNRQYNKKIREKSEHFVYFVFC